MQTSGGAAPSGALELKVIRAAEKPATAPTVLVSDKWVPDAVKQFSPRSRLGEYVKACARLLPRAMALGTGLVTLLYLALNAVFVYGAPAEKLAGQLEVARIAADSLGGPALANLVTALIADRKSVV